METGIRSAISLELWVSSITPNIDILLCRYSFLDTCAFARPCPACHDQVTDVLTHALNVCPRTRPMRLTLRLKLLLFKGVKVDEDTKFGFKTTLYSLAPKNRPFRNALCEFLIALGY